MAYIWMTTAGSAKLHLGSYEQAVAWFRRAIEANRNNPPAYLNLAAALAQLGRLDEARSAVRAGLPLNPAYTVSAAEPPGRRRATTRRISPSLSLFSTACARPESPNNDRDPPLFPVQQEEIHTTQETINLRVNPSDETIRLGPLAVRFLLTGENSTGSVAAFELVVQGAQRLAAPAHSHDHYEETIYGIDGVLTWTVDGKQFDVGPGRALCIPRGAIHWFDNDGIREAKALCVITPAMIGPQYFRETAATASRQLRLRRSA